MAQYLDSAIFDRNFLWLGCRVAMRTPDRPNINLVPLCGGWTTPPSAKLFLSRADSGDNLKTQLQVQMTHLLILLLYLFHYGRTEFVPLTAPVIGSIPFFVRSPYLNCWGSVINETTTNLTVVADCDRSKWSPSLIQVAGVCYFIDWNNTKIDYTLEL
jgi:hypothetical protein